MTDPLATLNAKIFAEHLHTRFKADLGAAGALELELAEVVEHNPSPQVECFSLFFRGPGSPQMQQGMKKLAHTVLGELEIFLTPVARDENGFTYETVFNRFRKPQT
jgi:hypothetical protein